MTARVFALSVLLLCAFASPVAAEPANWHATIGVIRLLLPLGELNVERRIGDQVGVGASAGYGQQTRPVNSGFGSQVSTDTVTEGALYSNYYFESFDTGFHVGAELRGLQLQPSIAGSAATQFLQIGGYGGYTYTLKLSKSLALVGAFEIGYKFQLLPRVAPTENNPTANATALQLVNLLGGLAF